MYSLAGLKIICHGGPFRFSPRTRQSEVYPNTRIVMKKRVCMETRSRGHKCLNELWYSSARRRIDRVMSAGMLTGRPEEEMPGSAGDMLQELSQLHEQAWQVMQGMAQVLWPSASLPGGMSKLVEMLKGARRRFWLWKISACRQGAREAWAMVKMRYAKADLNHMAEVGPVGLDG